MAVGAWEKKRRWERWSRGGAVVGRATGAEVRAPWSGPVMGLLGRGR
jgi:hypothetical protein